MSACRLLVDNGFVSVNCYTYTFAMLAGSKMHLDAVSIPEFQGVFIKTSGRSKSVEQRKHKKKAPKAPRSRVKGARIGRRRR